MESNNSSTRNSNKLTTIQRAVEVFLSLWVLLVAGVRLINSCWDVQGIVERSGLPALVQSGGINHGHGCRLTMYISLMVTATPRCIVCFVIAFTIHCLSPSSSSAAAAAAATALSKRALSPNGQAVILLLFRAIAVKDWFNGLWHLVVRKNEIIGILAVDGWKLSCVATDIRRLESDRCNYITHSN